MCFSASASFGASAILLAGGLASIKQVRSNSQLPFAVIPFVFSIQQLCEGFLWLSFTHPEYESWRTPSTYAFLIFAQVVWPMLVPVSILLMEKDAVRKKILKVVSGIGITLGIFLAYNLLFFPASARANPYHIHYDLNSPLHLTYVTGAFYLIATILPPLISSVRKMAYIGITILVSFLVTLILYSDYIISIWCFFAAIISFLVFAIIKKPSELSSKLTLLNVKRR